MRSQLGSLGHGLAQKVDQLVAASTTSGHLVGIPVLLGSCLDSWRFMTTAMQKITRIGEQLEHKAATGRLDQLEERLSKVLQGIERKAEDMALRRLEEQVIVLGEGVEGKAERNELQKAQEKLQVLRRRGLQQDVGVLSLTTEVIMATRSFLLVAGLSLTMTTEISRTFRCKAVITDVDGTLMPFGTNTKISETNQLALKKAFDEGLAVCVATGRIPGPWYDELCAQVPLGPGVFANAGAISRSIFTQDPCSLELACFCNADRLRRDFRRAFWRAPHLGAGCHHVGGIPALCGACAGRPHLGHRPHQKCRGTGDGTASDAETTEGRVQVCSLHPSQGGRLGSNGRHCRLISKVAGRPQGAKQGTGVTVLDCGARQCEILPPGVNKGSGVKKLLEVLGLSLDSALACGDAENDVEMLEMVGLGIAVGDGKPKALAAADIVVSPSTQDGVAEAIDFALGRLARDEAPDSLLSA
ncbi:YBEY [Symbiodinium microadriaticum]|nr:YBEY [Symbiodinium microadriaticum]